MKQNTVNSANKTCLKILELDESIRFVGRIKDHKVLSFARRKNSSSFVDEEMGNMAHYQASVKSSMEEMFDQKLGATNWMITSKEKVKLITIFPEEGLIILSIEPQADHDDIIKKIQNLNMEL